jgi:DNA invertase Pin-like site-specific DNA recombinase
VVYKLDRLSRSLRDGINVLSDWCDRGLRVVSVTQQIDFNGTLGKMLAAVLLGIAEMEQETRRERQAAGIAVAKKQAKYRGRKPGTTKAKPKRALTLRDKGLNAEEIAKSLGVSRNTVFRYLRTAKS